MISLGSLILHDPNTCMTTNLELHILIFEGCGLQLLCCGEACNEGLILYLETNVSCWKCQLILFGHNEPPLPSPSLSFLYYRCMQLCLKGNFYKMTVKLAMLYVE